LRYADRIKMQKIQIMIDPLTMHKWRHILSDDLFPLLGWR
jgi:hypothetical protein